MARIVRNRGLKPHLECEGTLLPPIPPAKRRSCPTARCPRPPTCAAPGPWARLYEHQTLSTVRHSGRFVPSYCFCDHFDYAMNTVYNHFRQAFADERATVAQPDTFCCVHRFLRKNTVTLPPPCTRVHPLVLGGIRRRRDPNNVRIGLPTHHWALAYHGYGRKDNGTHYTF